jgi:hypothetical protein
LKQRRIYRKLVLVAGPTTVGSWAALPILLALAPITDDAIRVEVARLAPKVAAARRLPFRGPLPARVLPPDGMRNELAATMGGSNPSGQDAILRRLGLLPARADGDTLALDNFAASGLPRYDPLTRRLLVPDAPSLDKQQLPLAHVIAHAIADERFGLRRALKIAPDGTHQLDGDAERARLALIEGDATLTTLTFADPREIFLGRRELAQVAAGIATAAANLPPWSGALGRFTHVDGLLFVARVRARQPWSAVDALWNDPPTSSEQVLHPERYDACEEPVPVDATLMPALRGIGPPLATDVMGELVIRTWLAISVSPDLADRAATGWGGDRAAIYRPVSAPDGGTLPAGDPLVVWLTVWDDPAEADDFARAATPIPGLVLERRAEAVALVLGGGETAPTVVTTLLDGWRDQKLARQKSARRARPTPRPPCLRPQR